MDGVGVLPPLRLPTVLEQVKHHVRNPEMALATRPDQRSSTPVPLWCRASPRVRISRFATVRRRVWFRPRVGTCSVSRQAVSHTYPSSGRDVEPAATWANGSPLYKRPLAHLPLPVPAAPRMAPKITNRQRFSPSSETVALWLAVDRSDDSTWIPYESRQIETCELFLTEEPTRK